MMLKKLFAVLLIMSVLLLSCAAMADEEFVDLNGTGLQVQLMDGFKRTELSEEDTANGMLDRFEEEKTGRILEISLNDEPGETLMECMEKIDGDPQYFMYGLTTSLNDTDYLSYCVNDGDIVTKYYIVIPEKGKKIQMKVTPYDTEDEKFWRPFELMFYSLRKAK